MQARHSVGRAEHFDLLNNVGGRGSFFSQVDVDKDSWMWESDVKLRFNIYVCESPCDQNHIYSLVWVSDWKRNMLIQVFASRFDCRNMLA